MVASNRTFPDPGTPQTGSANDKISLDNKLYHLIGIKSLHSPTAVNGALMLQ